MVIDYVTEIGFMFPPTNICTGPLFGNITTLLLLVTAADPQGMS